MKERVLGYKTKLSFGKYKGKTIRDVLIENPSYIIWASENVSWFKVKPYVLEDAIELHLEIEQRGERIRYRNRRTNFYQNAGNDYDDDVLADTY